VKNLRGQLPQALAVDQHHGQDRAGLDRDVEQIAAVAEPAFGDQQVAGAGDRQEFGDALDDAEQQGGEQVGHGNGLAGDGRRRRRQPGAHAAGPAKAGKHSRPARLHQPGANPDIAPQTGAHRALFPG
jgi:hypothetical protein